LTKANLAAQSSLMPNMHLSNTSRSAEKSILSKKITFGGRCSTGLISDFKKACRCHSGSNLQDINPLRRSLKRVFCRIPILVDFASTPNRQFPFFDVENANCAVAHIMQHIKEGRTRYLSPFAIMCLRVNRHYLNPALAEERRLQPPREPYCQPPGGVASGVLRPDLRHPMKTLQPEPWGRLGRPFPPLLAKDCR